MLKVSLGNMTTWGKKALKYLEDTDSGVFLGCETHLTDKEIETARGEARIRGWRGEFAPAAPTVKGGSSGGAVVLARKHLACQPLDFCYDRRHPLFQLAEVSTLLNIPFII